MPAFKDFVEANPSVDFAEGDSKFVMLDETGENAEGTVTALKAELDAQYAPLAATNTIVMTANDFLSVTGSPAIGQLPINRAAGWLFDASTAERVWGITFIPAHWATMTITFVWANASTGAGDVVLRAYWGTGANGTNLNTESVARVTGVTATAVTTAGVVVQSSTSAVTVTNPGGVNFIHPHRNASDAADTLANDCVLYGVVLTRAS
jgi:hypothetical protein